MKKEEIVESVKKILPDNIKISDDDIGIYYDNFIWYSEVYPNKNCMYFNNLQNASITEIISEKITNWFEHVERFNL